MSFRAVLWAFEQEVRPSSRKFVLVALANFAGDTGLCYPAVATIARLTCQKDETVREALDSLVREGILTDTGKRCGTTMQVKVYQLPTQARDTVHQKTPENGSLSSGKTPIKTPIKTPDLVGLCINNNLGTNGTSTPRDARGEAESILSYLNTKTSRTYSAVDAHVKPIEKRIKELNGTPISEIEKMIDRQVALWRGTEHEKFLRPKTLFNRTNFWDYFDSRSLPLTSGAIVPNYENGF